MPDLRQTCPIMSQLDRTTAARILNSAIERRAMNRTDFAVEAGISPKTLGRIANVKDKEAPGRRSLLGVAMALDRIDGEAFLEALNIEVPDRFIFRDDPRRITITEDQELDRILDILSPDGIEKVLDHAKYLLWEQEQHG